MVIPPKIRAELEAHARAEEPNEACGLLAFRDGRAERYLSPFGLRRQTLAALETAGRLRGLDRRTTVSDVTGRVVLVQPDALFPGCGAEPAPVDGLVALVPADTARLLGVGPAPQLPCYPRGTGAELSRWLPTRCLRVGVAPGHCPASLASLLEDLVQKGTP